MFQPSRRGLLLEAQARAQAFTAAAATLDEALALSAQTGEQVWAADLYRLQGELLHASSAPLVAVIAAFEQAIALVWQQQAKILELRATTSLCRCSLGQVQEATARARLVEILAWFTEGLDTPDLVEAQQLLDSPSTY